MFRGYVKTVNKECKMSFKNVPDNELLSLKEAEKLSEFAGILSNDVIVIDVDDEDQSEILMSIVEDLQLRCRVIKTTRGMHFYFKNIINGKSDYIFNGCGNFDEKHNKMLACGLEADIKTGAKNGYVICKFKGKDRPIIYDKFEDEDYQEVPKWLLPVKKYIDFASLIEGDGRNDFIWRYILTLQSNGFSKAEARECLTIINKYVMKDSLSEKELNVIMRDGAFKKEIFFEKGKFLFDKFANYIMNSACIRQINDKLHIYRDGIYISGDVWLEREMIKNIPNLKDKDRKEVLKYLNLIVPEVEMSNACLIAFKNGIYDIRDDSMQEFSPDIIITNKIPFNYNPGAYSELADKTLDKLASYDKQTRMLLDEAIGYAFFRRNELRTSFWLIGDKKCGKSTYFQMLMYVIGDENRSVVDLPDLVSNGFNAASTYGKLINVCDDVDDDYIKKTGVLKKLISGSEVQLRGIYQSAVTYKSYTKYYVSANDYVRFNDKSGAMLDRIINIPFRNVFSKDDADFDPFIISKLMQPEVAEYLIYNSIPALKRVLSNKSFTIPDCVEEEQRIIDKRNNPILIFFEDLTLDELINKTTQEVYLRYSAWCMQEMCQPLGNIEFSRQLSKKYNLTTKVKKIKNENGSKSYRIYIEK